ncbi:orotate phosphoribosyltransferase [Bacillus chungangensis]|uniref:Orotate phosphoribosyltransferase n=1 Tax=Bacillus chungangensis TaxID=587633 RepID=A0ABT9WXN1_9BACI|nr:orotate phosphoribosyltransferase [Bacillus chungangensis]MDQ0177632.1 orotate phosphoribosyltransferase [Bacillus chungangensis]
MKHKIAEDLLKIKAVFLQPDKPFTWSSGLRSPIYCDNRLTLSYPKFRKEIARGLTTLIKQHFPDVEVIAGTATAGIPHAAWVSDLMELPMSYVRSKAKAHGKGNQIEGKVASGQKVVVVEDLISTGGSVLTAVEALRAAECDVLGVASIFTYELEKAAQQLTEANIEAHSLTNYSALLDAALKLAIIHESDMETLKAWRQNPSAWGNHFSS